MKSRSSAPLKLVITAAWLLSATAAPAQPNPPLPPDPPALTHDFGDITIGAPAVTSPAVHLNPGGIAWYRFRLSEPVNRLDTWMDLDTAGPSTISNSVIVIYNEWGFYLNQDDNSGGGSNDNAAAMSYGAGSGQRLSGENPGYGGGRISDGAWGWLAPGVYYVGIIGYPPSYDPNDWPNPNRTWVYNNNSTLSGTVHLRIATGRTPASYWNARYHEGGDAGALPSNAMTVEGSGPLTTLVDRFTWGEQEMYRIRVCDPAAFNVVAMATQNVGGLYAMRLLLLDHSGRGVLGINGNTTNTTLPAPAGLQAGDYYLGVSSTCGGINGFDSVPYDAQSQALWNFTGFAGQAIPPNGPGALNPAVFLGPRADCTVNEFNVRLTLTGACYVESHPCLPCDTNFNGTVNQFDIQGFIDCLTP